MTASRPIHTYDTATVRIIEREVNGYVRFYLHYSLNGHRHRELIKDLPRIKRTDSHFEDFRHRAEVFRYELTESIRRGVLGRSEVSDLLLREWVAVVAERVHRRTRADVHRHTWARVIEYVGEIVEGWRANLTLRDVDVATLRAFTDYLSHRYVNAHGQRLAPTTVAKRLTAFSYVLKCAVREGLISANPFDALERGEKVRPLPVERDYLTADELHRLISTPCDTATRSVYLFMCYCGLRISDVERLRWGDVREDAGRWWLHIRQKKTQKPLILPLSETARSLLPTRDNKTANEPIFGDIPAEQTMNKRLKEWARSAGINKRLTLHTARHTFATLLLTQGADIYTVSKLLGQTSVQTTQIYARIVDEKKASAVDLLNEICDISSTQ